MDFYDKYSFLCTRANKKPTVVAEELGMTKSAASNWKQRITLPTGANLQRIADYFNVPVSFFDEDPSDELPLIATAHERELISIYRQMSPVDQAHLLVYAADRIKDKK